MVVKRQCSFCAREIEPGTGTMFVKRDGTVFHFCSSSCRKQQLHLGRVGHRFKWTRAHELKRATDHTTAQKAAPATTAAAAKKTRPGARRPASPKTASAPAERPTQAPAPVAASAAETTNVPAETPAETPQAAAKPRRTRKKSASPPSG